MHFDDLTRVVAGTSSRRAAFGMIAGTALMAGLAKFYLASAKKKGKGKNKKKRCRTLNQACGGKKTCCKGLSCTGGLCCPAGTVPSGGKCITPDPPECENDDDCSNIEICQDGACVPEPPECIDDNDCIGNEFCENGFCFCPLEFGGECVFQCGSSVLCPGSCFCRGTFPSSGTTAVCFDEPLGPCTGTIACDQVAECPPGFLCAFTTCDDPNGSGRCLPITCEG
jgi:hypothetical protein